MYRRHGLLAIIGVVSLALAACQFTGRVIGDNGSCVDVTVPSAELSPPTAAPNVPGAVITPCSSAPPPASLAVPPSPSSGPADEPAPTLSVAPSPSSGPAAESEVPSPSGGDGIARVGCALPKYPNPGCTGVPAGTKLTDYPLASDGAYAEITKDDAVLDKVHIAGDLLVAANNITIANSQIDGTVYNNPFNTVVYPYTISDSTVGPATGCITQPGLNEGRYIATRVRVQGHDDGFRVSEPGKVTVRDSYAKLCYQPPNGTNGDGSHSDGIQSVCSAACPEVDFEHNTVDAKVPATFMINFDGPNMIGVTANDNLLSGGAASIVTKWTSGPTWVLHNNRIVDKSWTYYPVSAEGTCAHQDWVGNSIVTIDANYDIISTVAQQPCVD